MLFEPGFSVPHSKNVGRVGRVNFLETFMLGSDIFLQLQRYTRHKHSLLNVVSTLKQTGFTLHN
jgi:hypothetical protein